MRVRLFCIIMVVVSLFAGCSNNRSVLTVEGSTSAEKVLGFLSEAFYNKKRVTVNFNPTGSGAGIEGVIENRVDFGVSSRKLKEEENEKVNFLPFVIDTVVVVVNKENPISDISKETLKNIFNNSLTNWTDVVSFSGKIVTIGRESGSGTRDAFESSLNIKNSTKYWQELTSSGDVVAAVMNNPNAIGYTSLSAVKDTVKVVSIDGVYPDSATVISQKYTLFREFGIITNKSKALSDTEKEFLDYVVSDEGRYYIKMAGFLPAG